MSHRRTKRNETGARLEMTSMIDVVFLLLVFFVVTVQPRDVLAKLNVSRPQASTGETIPLLRVDVGPDGYVINGRRLPLGTIKDRFVRIHGIAPATSVIVASTSDAPHSRLVKLLDVCAEVGLHNVSLMSL